MGHALAAHAPQGVDEIEGQPPHEGQDLGGAAKAYLATVLGKDGVEAPMKGLDFPMPPNSPQ